MNLKSFSVYVKHRLPAFNKVIEVDSDKSLSIRSFLIGSLCQGVSSVKNALESGDVKHTISVLKKLGVKIIRIKKIKFVK